MKACLHWKIPPFFFFIVLTKWPLYVSFVLTERPHFFFLFQKTPTLGVLSAHPHHFHMWVLPGGGEQPLGGWPIGLRFTLLDRCLKLYTPLWNIWTYQQLCKKNTLLVYNLTQIVYNFTQVVYFFTQQLVGSYVSQCCVNFLNSGLTV